MYCMSFKLCPDGFISLLEFGKFSEILCFLQWMRWKLIIGNFYDNIISLILESDEDIRWEKLYDYKVMEGSLQLSDSISMYFGSTI